MRPALEQGCGKQTPSAGKLLSGRICYVFLISKCRGDWDLGLCTTSGLAFGEPQRSGDFRKKIVFRRRKNRNLSLRWVLQTQVPKLCTDLDLCLLYILILGTYSKFAWENNFLSLGICFPQLCSSADRRFAASRSRLQKVPTNRFVSTTKLSMKYVVNWIPLRICVRSRNAQPHLKE